MWASDTAGRGARHLVAAEYGSSPWLMTVCCWCGHARTTHPGTYRAAYASACCLRATAPLPRRPRSRNGRVMMPTRMTATRRQVTCGSASTSEATTRSSMCLAGSARTTLAVSRGLAPGTNGALAMLCRRKARTRGSRTPLSHTCETTRLAIDGRRVEMFVLVPDDAAAASAKQPDATTYLTTRSC